MATWIIGLLALALAAGSVAAAPSNVRLACNDFPPHKIEHPASDGLAGFDVDIVREALDRAGRAAEISFMPWKRALEMTERGSYDGLCSCSRTKEREATLLFSDELGVVSVGLFARSQDALAGIATLADLKGRKVATVGGYNLESELLATGALVEATSSDKHALDMLVGGNVDLLYGYELTTRHFLAAEHGAAGISYKQIRRNPYYFCLSRAAPAAESLMREFNRGLAEMGRDGSIRRILERYQLTPP